MPLTPEDIQAAPGAPAPTPLAPESAPAPAAAAPEGKHPGLVSNPAAMLETLPEDLLKNPLIFSVAKGKPGAVSAPTKSKDPLVLSVVKHAQPLVAAGFGIFQSKDKKTSVLFNTQLVDAGDLYEADKEGRLKDIAPDFSTVGASEAAPAGAVAPGAETAVPASVPASQPAASVQNKLATVRGKNLQPLSPTSGAAPGQGNILNSILRPAV